jgi:hypothetical protein
LRETFLFLGMRRKIGLDVLGALARQLAVDAACRSSSSTGRPNGVN